MFFPREAEDASEVDGHTIGLGLPANVFCLAHRLRQPALKAFELIPFGFDCLLSRWDACHVAFGKLSEHHREVRGRWHCALALPMLLFRR